VPTLPPPPAAMSPDALPPARGATPQVEAIGHRGSLSRQWGTAVVRYCLVSVLVAVAAACGGSGASGDGGGVALVATAEEQGSISTPCAYSHSGPDDPIVHAHHAGASHRHDFFGATTTDAHSDVDSLLDGGTTCRTEADHAAYWAPALLADGEPLVPVEMLAYYRVPIGADATGIEPPPNGLEMIAGDAEATEPQDPDVVAWTCGAALSSAVEDPEVTPVPRPCGAHGELWLQLRFESCWDGENLHSDDHRSHLAPQDDDRTCPPSHPVLIPELTLEVRYPGVASGELTLASGPATGGHGDAIMAWDEDHLAREVDICLRHNRDCDVISAENRLDIDEPTPD
jgi:uncharacterized protein DUF1996